jgi:hypothetical protein
MAMYRYTAIFSYVSGATIGGYLNLKGGWTESVYWNSITALANTNFQNLLIARAGLLPNGAFISGYRIQQVDPSAAGQSYPANIGPPGGTNAPNQDIPQMALLLRVRSNSTNNVRSMRLAAMPDNQVSFGEYRPTAAYQIAMTAYLAQLYGWLMRVQDLAQPVYRIATIDAAGNVLMVDPIMAVATGQVFKVKRTIDPFNNQKGGKFIVKSVTNPSSFSLYNWPYGACVIGTMQPFVIAYPSMNATNSSIVRAVVRKIGRPSLGYRGRKSKTKR